MREYIRYGKIIMPLTILKFCEKSMTNEVKIFKCSKLEERI
jgi:hypothetical protein